MWLDPLIRLKSKCSKRSCIIRLTVTTNQLLYIAYYKRGKTSSFPDMHQHKYPVLGIDRTSFLYIFRDYGALCHEDMFGNKERASKSGVNTHICISRSSNISQTCVKGVTFVRVELSRVTKRRSYKRSFFLEILLSRKA